MEAGVMSDGPTPHGLSGSRVDLIEPAGTRALLAVIQEAYVQGVSTLWGPSASSYTTSLDADGLPDALTATGQADAGEARLARALAAAAAAAAKQSGR
jgi:hypothetical protein